MFEFLKKLFRPSLNHGTGALENSPDTRDVPYSAVATGAITTPNTFETDLHWFDVFNQWYLGTCVAHAFVLFKMWLDWKETGVVTKYSRRKFYAMVRQFAGWTEAQGQGLMPRDAGKVAVNYGFNEEVPIDDNGLPHAVYAGYQATDADRKEADKFKAKSYAFVNSQNPEEICQALVKEGLVMVSLPADAQVNWQNAWVRFFNLVSSFFKARHYVVFYGYEKIFNNGQVVDYKFLLRNSWGLSWGKKGNGEILYSEFGRFFLDMMVLADVPNDILKRAKESQFIFIRTLKVGMSGDDVKQLQARYIALGLWDGTPTGYFGSTTMNLTKQWQKLKGLVDDGIFGAKSREVMNADSIAPKTKLDLWISAIKDMEGAKPERNNIGNLRFIGQPYAVNDNGFCKFDTYEHGYLALKTLLVNACTGKSKVYHPDMTLVDFYNKYAPSSDGNNPTNYANFVAKRIGVPVTTQIKTLVA